VIVRPADSLTCQPVEISGRNWLGRRAQAEAIRHDPDWNRSCAAFSSPASTGENSMSEPPPLVPTLPDSFDGFRLELDPERQRADVILDRPPLNIVTMAEREQLRAVFAVERHRGR
jgi:hypothetical protein